MTVRTEADGTQTLTIPGSAGLVSISQVGTDNYLNNPMRIFYGLLDKDVEWDGAKGNMTAGMYPVLANDIQVMLNPTGVDGTAYTYEFCDSENSDLFGLTLGEAYVYSGDKLTTGDVQYNSRAVQSPSGVWCISRDLRHVSTNELDERADYVTQFKSNDGGRYAFALKATNKTGKAVEIKSQYLYSFDPMNVNSVTGEDFEYAYSTQNYYTYGVEHFPNFECYVWKAPTGSTGREDIYLSQVIYDYKLSIDKTKMTQVKIDEYGLEISADGHSFIAKNAQAVNNVIYLNIDYILINGQKGSLNVAYNIVNSDITVVENTVNLGTTQLEAAWVAADKAPFSMLANKFVDEESVGFNPQEVFGANYNQWIDAMYSGLNGSSDESKARFLKENATIVGGDPINNDAEYNTALINDLVYIDYVDAKGVPCIYGVKSGEELKRLQEIAGLKVYFIAGTTTGNGIISQQAVTAPYYTVEGGIDYWNKGFAIPLNNAFRVQVNTTKQEQTVASYNFTFELTQPELDITREDGEKAIWDNEKNILSVYGDKVEIEDVPAMNIPLYEAFTTAYAKPYSEFVKNAPYYTLSKGVNENDEFFTYAGYEVIGQEYLQLDKAPLSDIIYSGNANLWNSRTVNLGSIGAGLPIDAEYHFYGVYPATDEQVPDFTLRFASLLGDAAKDDIKTKANDYTSNNVTREVILTDDDFTLVDALGDKFYLFDGVKADGNVDERTDMNLRQGFEEGTEGFETTFTLAGANINAYYYKNNKKQTIPVTKGTVAAIASGGNAELVGNANTKTRSWQPGTISSSNIIVTDLPAAEAVKDKGYAAIPGGIMIQLPSFVGTTEPVTIEFQLIDVFGVTKTLSVTVKAAK